jgi:peptidoglycan hydrolase-like protein with peptidoglycan-binding domain
VTLEQVADAQRRLGLRSTGVLDDELWAAVRRFQMEQGLLVTGDLDDVTYQRLWETRLLRGPGPSTGEDSDPGPG